MAISVDLAQSNLIKVIFLQFKTGFWPFTKKTAGSAPRPCGQTDPVLGASIVGVQELLPEMRREWSRC
jgi:hypothetical protein